jgi:hypothetical protein
MSNEVERVLNDEQEYEFVQKVNEDPQAAFRDFQAAANARAAGEQVAFNHPEIKRCVENGTRIVAWLSENGQLSPTVHNMERAVKVLSFEKKLVLDPDYKPDEEELKEEPSTQSTSIDLRKVERTSADEPYRKMADEEFLRYADRLPADEYKRCLLGIPYFQARLNKLLEARAQQVNTARR